MRRHVICLVLAIPAMVALSNAVAEDTQTAAPGNKASQEREARRQQTRSMTPEERQAMRAEREARMQARQAEMRERMQNMSEEERQAMRAKMRQRRADRMASRPQRKRHAMPGGMGGRRR